MMRRFRAGREIVWSGLLLFASRGSASDFTPDFSYLAAQAPVRQLVAMQAFVRAGLDASDSRATNVFCTEAEARGAAGMAQLLEAEIQTRSAKRPPVVEMTVRQYALRARANRAWICASPLWRALVQAAITARESGI